jgi:hypothetical protein
MPSVPIGSIIGAIGGLVFVLVNAGAIPGTVYWEVAAVAAFLAIAYFVVLRGPRVHQPAPSRSALRTYGICVAAMVVAIPLGASLITNVLDKPDAVPIWVVFVVGVHFLPFARAFHLPVFRWLAVALMLVAALGTTLLLVSDDAAAAGWTGVIAGFVLLFFSAVGPRSRPQSSRSSDQRGEA